MYNTKKRHKIISETLSVTTGDFNIEYGYHFVFNHSSGRIDDAVAVP